MKLYLVNDEITGGKKLINENEKLISQAMHDLSFQIKRLAKEIEGNIPDETLLGE